MGTATYFSPEQAQGKPADPRSDLYSLGCVLYEMLTSRPPFNGETPVAIAYKHVQEQPPAPSGVAAGVPEALEAIDLKLLAKDPADRYPSAEDLRTDLRRFLEGRPVAALGAASVGAMVGAAAGTGTADATQALPATTVGAGVGGEPPTGAPGRVRRARWRAAEQAQRSVPCRPPHLVARPRRPAPGLRVAAPQEQRPGHGARRDPAQRGGRHGQARGGRLQGRSSFAGERRRPEGHRDRPTPECGQQGRQGLHRHADRQLRGGSSGGSRRGGQDPASRGVVDREPELGARRQESGGPVDAVRTSHLAEPAGQHHGREGVRGRDRRVQRAGQGRRCPVSPA